MNSYLNALLLMPNRLGIASCVHTCVLGIIVSKWISTVTIHPACAPILLFVYTTPQHIAQHMWRIHALGEIGMYRFWYRGVNAYIFTSVYTLVLTCGDVSRWMANTCGWCLIESQRCSF